MNQTQGSLDTKGVRSAERNEVLWDAFYDGWCRAAMGLPPGEPDEVDRDGWRRPDPERGEYHRKGHAARRASQADREGETTPASPGERGDRAC